MKPVVTLIVAAFLLSSCGTTMGDRGLSGAGIGAGIGVLGGPPGIVVGGLVGAGVGMVTSPRTVDLGQPVWRR